MALPYEPFYATVGGKAYLGDSLDVMRSLADESVSLIVTSPPFPLTFQKKKPAFRNAEIDMHFSLTREMVPVREFLATVASESPQRVAVLLYQGEVV